MPEREGDLASASDVNDAEDVTKGDQEETSFDVSNEEQPNEEASGTNSNNMMGETTAPVLDDRENPQDATINPSTVDFAVTVHDESNHTMVTANDNSSKSNGNTVVLSPVPLSTTEEPFRKNDQQVSSSEKATGRHMRRRTKRARVVEIADESLVNGDSVLHSVPRNVKMRGLSLPANQFETTLIRRAIRKYNDNQSDQQQDEEFGDTSLGMKLNIASGKVIIQNLVPLSDGRASPAQLSGVIKRGDVLLSIDGSSLVNVPADQLMTGLGPLSDPDVNGVYRRQLLLRFEAGGGIDLLPQDGEQPGEGAGRQEADLAADMFSLFPMVDQLGGAQILEPPDLSYLQEPSESHNIEQLQKPPHPQKTNQSRPYGERISFSLAAASRKEKAKVMSEFFTWNRDRSLLMRCDSSIMSEPSFQSSERFLTKEQYIERGQRAILGAGALARHMETADSGKDVRSFRSWNTTLSLYSRASKRRYFVLDAVSLPLDFGNVEEEKAGPDIDDEEASSGEESKDESEHADGDEFLLRLAAQDEIWRKQVVDYLKGVADGSLKIPAEFEEVEPRGEESHAANLFSNFLLGENISKILAQREKSQALPPGDVTAVLFDLTTKVTASVPDEVAAAGGVVSSRSTIVPFSTKKPPAPGSDILLATHFLVDEVLPLWIQTFKPLPWEHRRVIWPLEKQTPYGRQMGSSVVSDDSLTIDSLNSSPSSVAGTTGMRRRRNLREQIEDQELDTETKAETCFLLTYYFTQVLLPRHIHSPGTALGEYVKRFGSYLRLHTCLAYASALRCESVIETLLELANHDPKHREALKQWTRSSTWMFYEPAMLSSVMYRLRSIKKETNPELKQAVVDLCASAYPDVQPWQVQRELMATQTVSDNQPWLGHLYYSYLTLMLHPLDGHETARRSFELVNDWCVFSIDLLKNKETENASEAKGNFFAVASRASSSHTVYSRDLSLLLNLAMEIEETDLVLDLAAEVIDDPVLSDQPDQVNKVLDVVRNIFYSLLTDSEKSYRVAIRILQLMKRAGRSRSTIVREAFDVPNELRAFITESTKVTNGSGVFSDSSSLIDFLAEDADPYDVLRAIDRVSVLSDSPTKYLQILQCLLRRAANEAGSSELSVALLKVKFARMEVKVNGENEVEEDIPEAASRLTIWQCMTNGMVSIAK